MSNGRIRHATETFVNNLIDSVKKLITANTDQINVLSDYLKEHGYTDTAKDAAGASYKTLTTSGLYRNASGFPESVGANILQVIAGTDSWSVVYKLYYVAYGKIHEYTSCKDGTVFSEWDKVATTSKTDILFPFNTGYKQANDLGYTCKIVKNSLNEGTIYIAVAKTDGTDFAINTSHPIGNLPLGFRSKFNTVNSSSAGDLLVYYPNNNASLIIYNDVLFCSCSVACKAIYGQIKYEVV